MSLYKDTKAIVHTDFFEIVTEVLQGDKLGPYLFIVCQDYELTTSIDLMKENGLNWKTQEADHKPQNL